MLASQPGEHSAWPPGGREGQAARQPGSRAAGQSGSILLRTPPTASLGAHDPGGKDPEAIRATTFEVWYVQGFFANLVPHVCTSACIF